MLERTALSDFWKHTLSQIPTRFGRLIYCASLRDQNTGAYRHHGLIAMFGRDESEKAMRNSHQEAFSVWQSISMAEKADDFGEYLAEGSDPKTEVIHHWLTSGQLHTLVPPSGLPFERDLFVFEMEALLATLKNAAAGGPRGQGSSQRR